MSAQTPIEQLLRRDRWLASIALAILVLLAWGWIVPLARDMYGDMSGASAWMMSTHRGPSYLLLLFAMWAVMMVGMMLPSAAPALLLYAALVRRSAQRDRAASHIHAFVTGYLAVWTLFSAMATAVQFVLAELAWLSPMMQMRQPLAAAVLLLVAGAYQLTPMKRSSLDSCRSPAAFLSEHWQTGWMGAFHMGFLHGIDCLRCCWALMLLLFVGGIMNLYVIGAITLFVLFEKVAPRGVQGGRLSGVLLIAFGVYSLFML